jgi:exodeoxyribonuclease VII large subunit
MALRSPHSRLQSDRQRLDELVHRRQVAWRHLLQLNRSGLSGLAQRLDGLNPVGVLKRGYALVSRADGQIAASLDEIQLDEALSVRLVDGSFGARVTSLEPNHKAGRSHAKPAA